MELPHILNSIVNLAIRLVIIIIQFSCTVSVFFENKKIGTGTAGRCVCCVCGVHYVTPLLAVLERPGEELLRKVSEAVSCFMKL